MTILPISSSFIIPISTDLNIVPSTSKSKTQKSILSFHQNIKTLSKSGKLDEAIRLIESSPSNFTNPDTYSEFLHACISKRSFHHGERLYSHLQTTNLLNEPKLQSKFITLFSVSGRVNQARSFFDGLSLQPGHLPESVWVAMAIGYVKNRYMKEALCIYVDMLSQFIEPGNFAFSMALKACADLKYVWFGRGVHAQILKSNVKVDEVVYNSLLKLYTECGFFEEVLNLFDEMPQRNIVSWNSLISSFSEQDELVRSMNLFRKMQEDRVGFTWVTLTTILSVITRVTSLQTGKEVHAQMIKSESKPDRPVLNALIEMYAKTGEIDYCKKVFDRMRHKDVISWNTMINGYGINGYTNEAMELFGDMVENGVNPDNVTFLVLLSCCSHAGRVVDGRDLFDRMRTGFGVAPSLEHYAALVDLMGRAGRIDEALEVVKTMPFKPSGSVWGALLNSCRLHRNVTLGEYVANKLFEIEPNNAGNYVMLSNIYANESMWAHVNKIRDMMQVKGMKKESGCSWMIQTTKDRRIQTFVSNGSFEFRNSAMYKKVSTELMNAMEEVGYVSDKSVVLHDVNDETKGVWVCGHSERIATIFGLINSGDGVPIRVTKNLRVCRDCHSWMKIVSKVTRRKIVLRDTNRFHHFKGGTCSCKDYW